MSTQLDTRRHAPRGAAVVRVGVVVGLAAAAGWLISGDPHGSASAVVATQAPAQCSAATLPYAPNLAL